DRCLLSSGMTHLAPVHTGPALVAGAHMSGSAGDMPAFYDGNRFVINFKEVPANAEMSLLAHNKSINIIYMSDAVLPNGQDFVSVLDAMRGPGQGPGFNPLWQQVDI